MFRFKSFLVFTVLIVASCKPNTTNDDSFVVDYDVISETVSVDNFEECECGEISYFGEMGEGLLTVVRKGCDYYVNEFAELAIQDTFCDAEYFWGDYSVVVRSSSTASFEVIDRTGKTILEIEEDYDDMNMDWGSNYAVFEKNDLEGVMNLDGEIIIDLQPDQVHIVGDLALLDRNMKHTTIYDLKSGDIIDEHDLGYNSVSEGYVSISDISTQYYLDSLGEIAFGPFDWGAKFSEGLAKVTLNQRVGFINKNGEFEIPLQFPYDIYGDSEGFHDGRCAMTIEDENGDDKIGFIDRDGEMVIPPIYDYAFHFEDGMANVEIGDESFFINTSGEVVGSGYDYYHVAAPGVYFASYDLGYVFFNDQGDTYRLECQNISDFYNGRAVYNINDELKSISVEEIESKFSMGLMP